MAQTDRTKPTTFRRLVFSLSVRSTLIPILVFVSVFLFAYDVYSQHVLTQRNRTACETCGSRLEQTCSSYTGYLEHLAQTELVEDVLSGKQGKEVLYEDFYRFLNAQEYRGTFYLLNEKKSLIASLNNGESNISVGSVQRLADRCEINGLQPISEKSTIAISFASNERSRGYTMILPVVREDKAIGFLAYRFYEKGLNDFLRPEGQEYYVLTDRNGGIIASNMDPKADALDRFLPRIDERSQCHLEDSTYNIAKREIPNAGLVFYTLSSPVVFLSPEALLLVLLTLAVAGLCYFFYSRSLAKRITEPVDRLLDATQQLKTGNLTPTESFTDLEEFQQLFDEYNDAIGQLDRLMETQQNLKLHQLEAQFNPHFLYNVLETLKYTIATDTEAAQDIVLRLSHLMRYAASPAQRDVTLGEDMVYIEDYLALQKQRFLDRLSYRIEVDEDAKSARVFRLLLQPIVENSIKYGYILQQNIAIDIRCRVEGEDLVLSVADNGGGMSRERLAQVQQSLESGVNDTGCLGLYNTHQMIRLRCGPSYGLTLENRDGEGLTVNVRMPYGR